MEEKLIFLLDTCVWINLVESLENARESRIDRALEELKSYRIMTTPILRKEFVPQISKSSEKWERYIKLFVDNLETPDKHFFGFYFETYAKVISYLDGYFLDNKQPHEKHYLRKTSRQATLSDGDLSMVMLPFFKKCKDNSYTSRKGTQLVLPFVETYKDNTFIVITEDKINKQSSPHPSTKELTNPRRLFDLLKEKIIPDIPPPMVLFPQEKKDTIEDIIDIMENERLRCGVDWGDP